MVLVNVFVVVAVVVPACVVLKDVSLAKAN